MSRACQRSSATTSLNRHYISDIGRYLMEIDQQPGAYSASRKKLEAEMAEIIRLRDNPNAVKAEPSIIDFETRKGG